MDTLTEKQKHILWLEAMEKDFELIEEYIEHGENGKAQGLLHSCYSRAEGKRMKLIMEDAIERKEEAERKEAEFIPLR